jgi:hypothetical protein
MKNDSLDKFQKLKNEISAEIDHVIRNHPVRLCWPDAPIADKSDPERARNIQKAAYAIITLIQLDGIDGRELVEAGLFQSCANCEHGGAPAKCEELQCFGGAWKPREVEQKELRQISDTTVSATVAQN